LPKNANSWDAGGVTVLDTVELARVTPFGELNPWAQPQTISPADASLSRINNRLNAARAGLELLRLGRWLYALGGRPSAVDGVAALATIERARILGLESRPGVQWARRSASGSLPPGIYHYAVAAVSSEGEGLATREVSVRVDSNSEVTVQWRAGPIPTAIR